MFSLEASFLTSLLLFFPDAQLAREFFMIRSRAPAWHCSITGLSCSNKGHTIALWCGICVLWVVKIHLYQRSFPQPDRRTDELGCAVNTVPPFVQGCALAI